MCGICGIVATEQGNARITADRLRRMRDVLVHRGPDGAGEFLEHGVALGHRRLSIIDVEHGAQPMTSADGRYVIVYNGEVFNHPTLKAELESTGVRYETRCDTETVLHLFEREGPDAVHRLRGMFAIAIWDRARRELTLIRDRLGVKPLYYAHLENGTLCFGSEIKSLLASDAVKPSLNRAALPETLACRAPMGDETLFDNVRRLPPGHLLVWREGAVTVRRYWTLEMQPSTSVRSDAAWEAEFDARFREAVKLRLMSDVPLGVFLSGGIDSAAITSVMADMVNEPIRTFSVAFAEREANELHYARLVSERFKTQHHEVIVSPDEFFGALPRMVWHEDEPIAHPSSVPLHAVAALASQHVKVVLTGEGSDENLAGYPWYRATVLQHGLGTRWHAMAPDALRSAVRALVDAAPMAARRKLRRTFLYLDADLDALVYDNFGVFGRAWQSRLMTPALRDSVRGHDPYASIHRHLGATHAPTLLGRLLYTDLHTYLHELLMKQDQMSMAASIESRVPFLDHPLVEFAATMPDRMKLRGLTTKYVLRRIMRGRLPDEILSRKKMGFPVPIGAWLAGPYRNWIDQFVLSPRAMERGLFQPEPVRELVRAHLAGEAKHGERLWSLVNLEIWHRIFIDGESPSEIRPNRVRTSVAVAA